ncbi:MAG TPA: RNA polymerase sigma factor [Thermoanaerobaculia bacterium]|jgi:RNA polymerase sigma-70 factor (ECF subfamily)|nr:RNA polymerase sigma factor [Thermoanaerobaculia bacterium]
MTIRKEGGPVDEARFEAVYRQYYARIWRYYRTNSVADDEAHDLTQDAFKRLYERFAQIRGADPWPFLKAIAHSILLNRVRSRKTQKRNAQLVEIDDPNSQDDLPQTAEPDHAEAQKMARRRERLYREIEGLSDAQQQVLILQLEGQSYEEIAAELRITADAVKSRRRDALRLLKSRMTDETGGLAWPGPDPEEER